MSLILLVCREGVSIAMQKPKTTEAPCSATLVKLSLKNASRQMLDSIFYTTTRITAGLIQNLVLRVVAAQFTCVAYTIQLRYTMQ